MADKTYTEGETYALVNDAVARETAAATKRADEAEAQNTELKNRADVLEAEKAAETKRADEAAKALEDFKISIENEKAQEATRTERTAKVTEVAPDLEMTEERSNRIVAMSDEAFESYVADLREVAAKKPAPADDKDKKADAAKAPADKEKASALPRESAAFGGSDNDDKPAGTVLGVIGAGRALRAS